MQKKFLTIFFAMLGCCVASSAKVVDSLLIDAIQKYEGGDVSGAAIELFDLSRRFPDNDAVFYYLGLCDLEQDDNIAAAEHLGRAWQLDTNNLWYGNAYAGICLARKEYEKAYPVLKKIIRDNPSTFATPHSLSVLAELESERGQYASALELYDQSIAMDPSYFLARLGKAETLKDSGDEEGYMAEVESLMCDDNLSDQMKAEYFSMSLSGTDGVFLEKWRNDIIGIVEKCETLYPSSFVFHYMRIQFADPAQTDLIIKECEAALQCSDIDDSRILFCLSLMGDSKYMAGDADGAFKAYEQALKIDSRYLPILNNYAYFLALKQKKLKKALKMSAVTIEDDQANPVYLDTYGWILHLLGRNEEAEIYLKQAMVNGGRESKEVVDHFIVVLDALGKTTVADFYRDLSKKLQ